MTQRPRSVFRKRMKHLKSSLILYGPVLMVRETEIRVGHFRAVTYLTVLGAHHFEATE